MPCGSNGVLDDPDERRVAAGAGAAAEDDVATVEDAGTRGDDADEAAGGRPEDATADRE